MDKLLLDTVVVVTPTATLAELALALVRKRLLSPVYLAVIVWLPRGRVEVDRLAVPLSRLVGDPKSVPSTTNWTVPPVGTGVETDEFDTAAVSVTDCPELTDAEDTETVVVVLAVTVTLARPNKSTVLRR